MLFYFNSYIKYYKEYLWQTWLLLALDCSAQSEGQAALWGWKAEDLHGVYGRPCALWGCTVLSAACFPVN